MRQTTPALCLISWMLASCGGGGSGGGTPAPPPAPPPAAGPPPTVSFSSDVGLLVTETNANLSWTSDGTACTATGGWTGAKSASGTETVGPINQNTTFGISCTNNGSAPTTGSVTVNIATWVPPPAPTATRVVSDLSKTVLDYARLSIGIRDIVWDSHHSLFYAVTRPDSSFAPNSLLSIDPLTRATQVRALTTEPWCVAVSKDGTYLFVGFKTGGTIQRLFANGLATDIIFSVGNPNSWVAEVAPSPASEHTIAARVTNLGTNFDEPAGIEIVDDTTVRPNSLHGTVTMPSGVSFPFLALYDIDWSADATHIYATQVDVGSELDFAVDAQGVTVERLRTLPLFGHLVADGDKLVSGGGFVFSLNGPIELLGRMPGAFVYSGDYALGKARGKLFFTSTHLAPGAVQDGMTVTSVDPVHYTPIDTITFNGPAIVDQGFSILWGNDGIALLTDNELTLAHGTFAAAGGVPPPAPDTLPVFSNATPASGPNGLSYKIIDAGALDAVANPCGELYVSTARWSAIRPNSVLQVNLTNASITRSTFGGSDPYILAASDDCSTLYAGREFSNSVARIRLQDFTTTDELPTGSATIGPVRAQSIAVAPGQAQTVAFTRGEMTDSLCSGFDASLFVFDGATPRPAPYDGGSHGIKSIDFGASANILFGEDNSNSYAFNVDFSGANNPQTIMPTLIGTYTYDLGRDLHYDRGRNRVFNGLGYFYDVAGAAGHGPLALVDRPFILGCSLGQTVTTDRTTGKIFWVNATPNNQIAVTAYDPLTLANLGRIAINTPGVLEIPQRVVRVNSNSLAIVTASGYLILVQGGLMQP